jgi:hypothetical protein
MTLSIDMTARQEAWIAAQAEERGLAPAQIVRGLIDRQLPAQTPREAAEDSDVGGVRRALMERPMSERRLILAEQADRIAAHYDKDQEWRKLQGGDIVDYCRLCGRSRERRAVWRELQGGEIVDY